MGKIIYIDCFSGISGDMTLGALLDIGLDEKLLILELGKLPIDGYALKIKKEVFNGISCTDFKTEITSKQPSRNYNEIKELIGESELGKNIKKIALSIFKTLADAESKVHSIAADELHFHEIGAVDSIIDIVGTAIGLDHFNVQKIYSSPVPLGTGYIDTAHGKLPVPAPATLEILRDVPIYTGDFDFEVTTPTGAAILKSSVDFFCKMPFLKVEKIGYGRGSRKLGPVPNLLRLLLCNEPTLSEKDFEDKKIGSAEHGFDFENITMLSTNIDDSSPEIIGYLSEKLLEEHALDVWTEPIFMKKNRQAVQLNVLCKEEQELKFSEMIFKETTTLGIRSIYAGRYFLERKEKTVKLPYGDVKVKLAYVRGKLVTFSPEFESCKKLSIKSGKSLKEVYRDVGRFFSTR